MHSWEAIENIRYFFHGLLTLIIIIIYIIIFPATSEGHDRSGIGLPGNQGSLVKQVKDQIADKPLIVVLMSGGSVDISNETVRATLLVINSY